MSNVVRMVSVWRHRFRGLDCSGASTSIDNNRLRPARRVESGRRRRRFRLWLRRCNSSSNSGGAMLMQSRPYWMTPLILRPLLRPQRNTVSVVCVFGRHGRSVVRHSLGRGHCSRSSVRERRRLAAVDARRRGKSDCKPRPQASDAALPQQQLLLLMTMMAAARASS